MFKVTEYAALNNDTDSSDSPTPIRETALKDFKNAKIEIQNIY